MSSNVGLTKVLKLNANARNARLGNNETSLEAVKARSLAGLPEPLQRPKRPTTAVAYLTAATNNQNRQSLNTIELKNLKRVAETMGTEEVRASYSRANMMIATL